MISESIDEISDELWGRLASLPAGVHRRDYEHCVRVAKEVYEIRRLKREADAAVFAHSYARPEILYGVADFVGDSLQLAREAVKSTHSTLVFSSVRFMAETAKILCPEKRILSANAEGGCSLADSIDARTVRRLRRENPECVFVCYVNTTAEVKAECDVCVTSANAETVIRNLPENDIYFLPDSIMGENLADACRRAGLDKRIRSWSGSCYVHEQYSDSDIAYWKLRHPGLLVLAHPECPPTVCAASDFVGGTGAMLDFVRQTDKRPFLVLTECGLVDRMRAEMPDKILVGTCSMCRYMKSNSLAQIKQALVAPPPEMEITLDAELAARARKCLERMESLSRRSTTAGS